MNTPATILCLDLSLRTGWAAGAPGQRPVVGAWKLPDTHDLGRCYASLDNEMRDAIDLFQPKRIVCEAPIRVIDCSSELLWGLWATAQQAAYRQDVRIEKRAADTVRPAVMGIGAGRGRSADIKRRVMSWCRDHGWPVYGDDEGDATILWLYETGFRAPKGMRYGEQRVAA